MGVHGFANSFSNSYVHQLKEYHMLTTCRNRGFTNTVSVGHRHEGCIMYHRYICMEDIHACM